LSSLSLPLSLSLSLSLSPLVPFTDGIPCGNEQDTSEERYKSVGAISDPGKKQKRNEIPLLRAVKRLIDIGGGVD